MGESSQQQRDRQSQTGYAKTDAVVCKLLYLAACVEALR